MAASTGAACSKDCSRPSRPDVRAYVAVTGLIFVLMVAAHVARIVAEGTGLLREPMIIATSLIALGLTVWAVVLLVKRPR